MLDILFQDSLEHLPKSAATEEGFLPQVLDDLSNPTPERIYATIPRLTKDLSQGFKGITVSDVARCVNAPAWWLQENVGRSNSFETLCYIGLPDIRSAIVFLVAIKCGYKVYHLSRYCIPRTGHYRSYFLFPGTPPQRINCVSVRLHAPGFFMQKKSFL